MKMPHGKLWTLAFCVLCAAALALPVWAAEAKLSGATQAAQSAIFNTVNPSDNGALFYGYLLQRAGASNEAALMSDAGSKLTGKDKELYDLLKVWIADIASGKETSAVYEIVYDDFPLTWTAEELGVSDCASEEGQKALNAKIDALYDYDMDAVIDALLADFPYELYWYDKAEGVGYGYGDLGYKATSAKIMLDSAPSYAISMSVSQDYGGGLTVNRNLHDGIESAVANATAIVSDYAGKSDYDKLLGYSTEICALADYDDAAAENPNTPYGDPWQLISVFDKDPNTSVVCEGYAKAFKYLCDLSQFNSSKVECYLVSGALSGGTGAGRHMWNVVTMDNGKSYLVDATNSDSNGGPEYLLLKGGSPDNANATQYTFDNFLTYLYDNDTLSLWGSDLLTLDTADYKDAAPVTPTPEPLKIGAYALALSASGEAVSMGDLRGGASIAVTANGADAESKIILFLAVYNAQGRMTDLQQWELDLSQSSASIRTQALAQGAEAARAKFIILNERVTPLAASGTLE